MTRRGLGTLALLAAVLVGVAVYVSSTRRTGHATGVGELLYPGLEASLDEVKSIRILGADGTAVVNLTRGSSGWQVAERSGYAADASRVRTILLGLAQARQVEEKTSLAANYSSLGVEDLAGGGATGAGVELEGQAQPVSLIVGKSPGARSAYVRRKGETASWQVSPAITVERDPSKWLATELVEVGADRIQSAEFVSPGKRPWSAAKASRADLGFAVTGKPAGGSSDSGNVDRIASSLAGLRLTDVRRASDVAELKPAVTATYRTFDGLVLAVEGYTEGEKRFVRIQPSLDEAAARRFFVATAPPAAKEPAAESAAATTAADALAKSADAAPRVESAGPPADPTAPASTPDAVIAQARDEAAKLETRLAGWMFEIPSWSYDSIFPQP